MDKFDYNIECLRTAVENKLSRTFKSPLDFDFLSRKIQEESGETLSSHTLMRIWKYIQTDSTPRRSSLSLLSRYVGYKDFDTFQLATMRSVSTESGFMNVKYVRSEDLHAGDMVKVAWLPDRVAMFLCLGNNRFVVKSCTPCSLKPGDEFSTAHFQEHVPLFAVDLNDGSGKLKNYIAGRENGLTMVEIIPKINNKNDQL